MPKYILFIIIINYKPMETTVNERIKLISKRFCNGNISELARIVGVNQPSLRDIVGTKQVKPGFDIIYQLVGNAMLNINAEWLILGVGEIQKLGPAAGNNTEVGNLLDRIEKLAVKIHELERIIEELKKPKEYELIANDMSAVAEPNENIKHARKKH